VGAGDRRQITITSAGSCPRRGAAPQCLAGCADQPYCCAFTWTIW